MLQDTDSAGVKCPPGHICPGRPALRDGGFWPQGNPHGAGPSSSPLHRPSPLCSRCEIPDRKIICHPEGSSNWAAKWPRRSWLPGQRNQFPEKDLREGQEEMGAETQGSPTRAPTAPVRLLSASPPASRRHPGRGAARAHRRASKTRRLGC